MKRTAIRLGTKTDKCVDRLSKKFKCTRQDAITLAIEFLADVVSAKSGDTLKTPDGTEFLVEFR